MTLAESNVHPAVFNHSVRVFLHALELGKKEGSSLVQPDRVHLLWTASILHDLGTTDPYDGPQRFEVKGADAASQFLKSKGISDADAHEVWVAIAIHTSPGIAERISELARLVRLGVMIDFGRKVVDVSKEFKDELEDQWPRESIEKILGDAVVAQAVKQPQKAPKASWPGVLYSAHLENPGWDGVNKGF